MVVVLLTVVVVVLGLKVVWAGERAGERGERFGERWGKRQGEEEWEGEAGGRKLSFPGGGLGNWRGSKRAASASLKIFLDRIIMYSGVINKLDSFDQKKKKREKEIFELTYKVSLSF